jgi:phytoene dehydrogenase-like protein
MTKTVHIIGAGISGLSAAVRLANENFKVHVHEATQQAGGRCRSYFDAATNLTIDNGNHLLLSGQSPCAGLRAIDRHGSGAGRAEERAIPVRRS